ncbi:hypothetical protein R3P38DRAFT_2906124 [Favolaschia claudopus]|uniref:DUF6535 domain-containing protein n=1 Tax=Favolaschia claudopus TaxID=2862362 RepID=A0AAW0CHJ7_9AGAR
MPDVELHGNLPRPKYADSGDEAAAAKIWAVYAGEAEKYDKGLVQSWKSDMEGMIIFAGLFSAVLTAFLVESYKTLNPDPGDITVLLLARISDQLAASANGTASPIPLPLELDKDVAPTAAAWACNALWFLSLGLSLTCALIATLLEQWAREFLHRTDIHSAPLIRARIFSFLYYGLRRFNIHAVVDIIPLLLHLALLLFFSGLVAFLIPVNTAIAIIAAAMLLTVVTAYSVLTVFPLRFLDSPYRTPLTGVFWGLYQYLKHKWRRRHHIRGSGTTENGDPSRFLEETMIAAISRAATEVSEHRTSRDLEALIWTIKSLADDAELEPFVDAIPDILWGPNGPRETYSDIFRNLINNPRTALHARIVNLYHSCEAGLLSPTTLKRRKIVCYKAIWTTIPLLRTIDSTAIFPRFSGGWVSIGSLQEKDLEVLHFAASVQALVLWKMFENDKRVLHKQLEYLSGSSSASVNQVDSTPARLFIDDLIHSRDYFIDAQHIDLTDTASLPGRQVPTLIANIRHILTTTPYLILFPYLRSASALDALPYSFRWTLDYLRQPKGTPPAVRYDLDATFEVVVPRLLERFNDPGPGWMDAIMNELILYWPQQGSSDGISLHPTFLRYLNERNSKSALSTCLARIAHNPQLWEVFASHLKLVVNPNREDTLAALWRLLAMPLSPPPSLLPRLLDACLHLNFPPVAPSVTAILKSRYLRVHSLQATDPGNLMHRWMATTLHTSIPDSEGRDHFSLDDPLDIGEDDASVVLYTEFLELCASLATDADFPHQPSITLSMIDPLTEPSQVHETNQIRFASAVRSFFASPRCTNLRTVVINSSLFDAYAGYADSWTTINRGWLDNAIARDTIVSTLRWYAEGATDFPQSSTHPDLVRTRSILVGIRLSSGIESRLLLGHEQSGES